MFTAPSPAASRGGSSSTIVTNARSVTNACSDSSRGRRYVPSVTWALSICIMSWNSPASVGSRPGRDALSKPFNATLSVHLPVHNTEDAGRWGSSPTRQLNSSQRGFPPAATRSPTFLGLTPPPSAKKELVSRPHPAAGAFNPDSPASGAFLAANRTTPEARAAWKEARASLPAAGLGRGNDCNSKTSTTWLSTQKYGEPHRAFVG